MIITSPQQAINKSKSTIWIKNFCILGVSFLFSAQVLASTSTLANSEKANLTHPSLVINATDITKMRLEIKKVGSFQKEYFNKRQHVDKQIRLPIIVPIPKDAGGGYTHGVHVNNSRTMYDAGIIYQISGDKKYAQFVREVLLQYAQLYPTLPLHPQRKTDSVISAGKLFWQNLNESVWLVYTIQAYDAILPTLSKADREKIENGLFRPIVQFLSVDSEETFNKIHNHATWATCAVGMTGYVLNEKEWVEKALLGSDKTGKGGFLKQLQELFSPDGYYNEGPYYQRYALLPFVTFAKAIEVNEPQRKIFQYRDGIILKAIDSTIQLSYNKLFFPINDAIKDKGIDTIELVNGVAIAYNLTGNRGLLSIAEQQKKTLLTGDGLSVAKALDQGLQKQYAFKSQAFNDGSKGDEGALVVMRDKNQALVYKATAQGLGHGHFDKLSWLFYDKDEEIVSDYGAARFLNIEAKFGGRYLPENKTYANQTIAHNTLVVDETSHFKGNTEVGNERHPELLYFEQDDKVKISSAIMKNAYDDVPFIRTMAQISLPEMGHAFIVDILSVKSQTAHQFDLPLQYKGHLVDTNFKLETSTKTLTPLGKANGYQFLWLKAKATPKEALSKITWINKNGRFYTLSTINSGAMEVLFTQIGANDPNFNLRNENALVLRIPNSQQHDFVSILEPHGEYDPVNEFTVEGDSKVSNLQYQRQGKVEIVHITFSNNKELLLALNNGNANELTFNPKQLNSFSFKNRSFEFTGRFKLFELKKSAQ
jgi:hypothetical protein